MKETLRTAVVGVGYLGRFHAQKYLALPGCSLVGVMDSDAERLSRVSAELGVPGFASLEALLPQVEALSIAVPTSAHFQVGLRCLEAGKHLLMEKPLAATVAESARLVSRAAERGVVLQVGYLERFNPGFVACRERIVNPEFIDAVRVAPFTGRGGDVDIVLDMMVHDLDLILALVPAELRDLHAVGKSLVTETTDIASVRLMFADGCVANLTASRVAEKTERTFRVFQENRYFSIDLLNPGVRILSPNGSRPRTAGAGIAKEEISLEKGDSLQVEIAAFLEAVRQGTRPVVSGEDGLRTMEVAEQIIRAIAEERKP